RCRGRVRGRDQPDAKGGEDDDGAAGQDQVPGWDAHFNVLLVVAAAGAAADRPADLIAARSSPPIAPGNASCQDSVRRPRIRAPQRSRRRPARAPRGRVFDDSGDFGYGNMPSRGGAAAARRAHNPKVGGSNPSPATKPHFPEPRSRPTGVLPFPGPRPLTLRPTATPSGTSTRPAPSRPDPSRRGESARRSRRRQARGRLGTPRTGRPPAMPRRGRQGEPAGDRSAG